MKLEETMFDTAYGLERFSHWLSAGIKGVNGSKVITVDCAYKLDQIGAGSYTQYGRFLGSNGSYWVGLDLQKTDVKMLFTINPNAPNFSGCSGNITGRTFQHVDTGKVKSGGTSPLELPLVCADMDRLASDFETEATKAKIIKDFLDEIGTIVG